MIMEKFELLLLWCDQQTESTLPEGIMFCAPPVIIKLLLSALIFFFFTPLYKMLGTALSHAGNPLKAYLYA